MSTNTQILHILRNATEPMDAHSIYVAGAFEYELQCMNALASLSKKGFIEREKKNKIFHYWAAKDVELPDYMESDLQSIAVNGMPAPPPDRRIGLSRAEYTSKDKKAKREAEISRSTFRSTTTQVDEIIEETLTIQVEEPLPVVVEQIVEEPKLLEAPKEETIFAVALRGLDAEQAALNAKIGSVKLLRELTLGKAERLRFILNDYIELMDYGISGDGSEGDNVMKALQNEAGEFIKMMTGDVPIFKRAAFHLRGMATINDDVGAGDTSAYGEKRRADAYECFELAAMLDP